VTGRTRIVHVVVCGAGPAVDVDRLVGLAQPRGWDVFVIATPTALDFVAEPDLETQTGHPVRSQYRKPGDGTRSLPRADAIIVAPASFNTVNKLANGISDTYALGILAEGLGLGIPIVIMPFVNTALASHYAYGRSIEGLRRVGVTIIEESAPHPPGTGGALIDAFPWMSALLAAEAAQDRPSRSRD
jgi:phosphopantothenoylcysteine synthetase/decarboxylase